MISFKQYLDEEFFQYVKGNANKTIEISKNPSVNEMISLTKLTQGKWTEVNIRCFITKNNDIFAWDAWNLSHKNAISQIKDIDGTLFAEFSVNKKTKTVSNIVYVSNQHGGKGIEKIQYVGQFVNVLNKQHIKIDPEIIEDYKKHNLGVKK